jgi:signal transduction histidine kinase
MLGINEAAGIDDVSWLWPMGLAAVVSGLVTGMVVLGFRFWTGDSTARRQICSFGLLQLALTAGVIAGLTMGTQLSDATVVLVFTAWAVGVVATVIAGVTRHGLYDVRFVVRRAALYTVATAVLSCVFVGVYLVLSTLLSQTLSSGSYPWFAIAAAVVVVLVLDPVRRHLVNRVENRVLGDRRRPLDAFARLHNTRDSVSGEVTYASILQALVAAVRAPGAALVLGHGSELRTVALEGTTGDEPIVLPVLNRGELMGEILLGRRTPGEEYPEMDRLLLEQLVAQAAAQIYGVRRDQELAETRREALAAVVDERGRLGRDLHDGLAPLLAGAGLTADALRRDLAPGSQGEQDAARLADRLRHAAGEVRNIAHGLAPGDPNEDLGTALRGYLDGLSGPEVPRFTAHIQVDALPPVVANGVYLVVLEAVNNVIRHAHARHVRVQVRTDSDDVLLKVEDDGRGIARPYVSGFGITSMRKRVEALGGKLSISTPSSGGTLVEANMRMTP